LGSFKYLKRSKSGKVDTPFNKELENVEWGEYKLGDLFEIQGNPQLNKDSFIFDKKGKYPYFTRTVFNNGIFGYVKYLDEKHKIKGNCLAVGMMGMQFFYMKNDFYAGQFTKRAIPKSFVLNEKLANYFIALLNKKQDFFKNLLVRHFEKSFYNEKIQLPTKNGNIDFDFMESFIEKVESKYIGKLEAYLSLSGLNNYDLTVKEEQILKYFENIEWGKFRLGVLFEKIKTKKLSFKADELPKQMIGKYTLPCLTSSFQNQGLNYFAPKDGSTVLKNVISLPSNSDVYRAYFQSNEFTVLSDAYAIQWILNDVKLLPNQYLFAVQCINKVTDLSIYSYKNKLGGWNVVKNKYIQLPIKNDKPDYEIMDTLISAIQKLVIKDVVLYLDKR